MEGTKTKWIEFNQSYQEFEKLNLNKPGVLIETKYGVQLIGDINEIGGLCDCCTEIWRDTIIKKYKVVWKS